MRSGGVIRMSVPARVERLSKVVQGLWTRTTARAGQRAQTDRPAVADPPADDWVALAAPPRKRPPVQSPRFRATGGDQLTSGGSDPGARARVLLAQALAPSHPVTDPAMFSGRAELLEKLIRAIESQRLHAVIFGERGIGKTSILHVLATLAQAARYHVVYVSCSADTGFSEMIRSIAEGIPLLYHTDYGPLAAEAEQGRTFADLLPQDQITVRAASNLFAKIVGTRVLVLMDEFDRSRSEEFQRRIADLMKNLSDQAARLQLVIAGVASNFNDLIAYMPGIRRNLFALSVPAMNDGEVRALVTAGATATSLVFDEAPLSFIVTAANGLPYVATLLGHHAALAAIDSQRTRVVAADVANGVAEALSELMDRMSKRSQLQIGEVLRRGAHRALARVSRHAMLAGGRFSRQDVHSLHAPADAARCEALIESLAREGFLIEAADEEFGRRYSFLEESIPAYLWLLVAQEQMQTPAAPTAPFPGAAASMQV
jgi:hypothetical protein